ncbi:MAG TPA: cytochrome c oxidase accessory protein CcoG [Magnetospirillum sp.]|nr:cytochrome c oxidase accessory protein CcoG [Magnetospirillum sp.]
MSHIQADSDKASKPKHFYASSGTIHPRSVHGTFRNLKWAAMGILLAVWHLAPFLRWDRGPGAPDQAILIDLPGRRAYFFFIEIWPQEVYYLTGLLLFAAIALFFMSALAGRLWCGFLCWQTVYTDLFVQVERLVIGDRNARIALDKQKWNGAKLVKRATVMALWLLIAAACGIGFALYFDDAFTLLGQILTGQASFATYGAIAVVGGGCFIMAGLAREQVCIYMCPYARFQSAMFDEHSAIISYEAWRGEARGPAKVGQDFAGRGHCVDCGICQQSCPTGVDIRNGNQLACIGCGLCIDACNAVMDRYGLPHGLITYDSTTNQQARERGDDHPKLKLLRLRTLLYVAILSVIGGIMVYSLGTRKTLDVNVLHERSPLFVELSNGEIRNGYTYKVLNMVRKDRELTLSVSGVEGARIELVGEDSDASGAKLSVPGDSVGTFRLYVTAPRSAAQGKKTQLEFTLRDNSEGITVRSSTLFAAPGE